MCLGNRVCVLVHGGAGLYSLGFVAEDSNTSRATFRLFLHLLHLRWRNWEASQLLARYSDAAHLVALLEFVHGIGLPSGRNVYMHGR